MMFVHAVRVVPVPIARAQHRLRTYLNLSGDLGGDAVAAFQEGQRVLDAGPAWLHTQVLVQSLRPVAKGDATVVPLRWVATGQLTSLLPVFDAGIELNAAGDDTSRLALRGNYRPPLGKVGALIDTAILHTVAQATADAFLTRVDAALRDPAAAPEKAAAGDAATAVQRWLLDPDGGAATT